MNRMYTVRPDAPGNYVVIDVKTGAYVNRFHLPGELSNGPIVANDTCTITTTQNGVVTGYVVRIPSGALVNRYIV